MGWPLPTNNSDYFPFIYPFLQKNPNRKQKETNKKNQQNPQTLPFKITRSAYQGRNWEEIFVPDKSMKCLEDKRDCVMSSFQFAYGLFSVFESEAALSWLQAEAHNMKKPNSLTGVASCSTSITKPQACFPHCKWTNSNQRPAGYP